MSLKTTQRRPSRKSEVLQPPTSQSVPPGKQETPAESSNDDFLDLRMALMALGDPSDDMLRISKALRSFVQRGQDTLIYWTAQELYDYGLAPSTTGKKALKERQASGKVLKSEMPTEKMQQIRCGDTTIGRDTKGDSVQEHQPKECMKDNTSNSGLLKLSEKFARGIEHWQNGTLHKDPTSLPVSKFNIELTERNHLRHTPTKVTTIETLLKEVNETDSRHDCTYMRRRKIEVRNFYDGFDFWYQPASDKSNDTKASVRLREMTKMSQNKETVEEYSSHILQLAIAIRGDCALLVSYLNWINREKLWGLLDEGRYKAHCLVRRWLMPVEDDFVPQSVLEALNAPATCANSIASSEPRTIAIGRALERDESSEGQASMTFENRLRQVCRLHNVFYSLTVLLIICAGPASNENCKCEYRWLDRGGRS